MKEYLGLTFSIGGWLFLIPAFKSFGELEGLLWALAFGFTCFFGMYLIIKE